MPDTPPAAPSERLYTTAIAELALERAARLQALATEQERVEREAQDAAPTKVEGFARRELLAAARGAGIDASFVEVALAELDTAATLESRARDPKASAAISRWLGTERRNLLISRRLDGSPEQVWDMLVATINASGGIELVSVEGGHPAKGGVAVFHALPLHHGANGYTGYTRLNHFMHQLGLESVQVTLHPEGEHTRLRVVADLRPGMTKNTTVYRWLAAILGIFSAGLAPLAAVGLLASVGAGALGLLGGGGLVLGLARWAYPRALAGFEVELGTLLDKVASALTLGASALPSSTTPLALVGS